MEAVLTKLGNPRDFAQKYSGRHNYLIGPEYYGDYCWVMKVFLLSTLAFHMISVIFQAVFSPGLLLEMSFYVKTVFTDALISLIGGFGMLTLLFGFLPSASWEPAGLPHKYNVPSCHFFPLSSAPFCNFSFSSNSFSMFWEMPFHCSFSFSYTSSPASVLL